MNPDDPQNPGSHAGSHPGPRTGPTAPAAAAYDGAAGANLPLLRGHNAALVLDLLRTAGEAGISRLELAERTGLTPQAVSKITARLRADGTAAEAGFRASTGGKPRTVLRLVPEAAHAVGVHLDRDEVTAVLVDLGGRAVASRRAPLDLGGRPEAVLDIAVEQIRAVAGSAASHPRPPNQEQEQGQEQEQEQEQGQGLRQGQGQGQEPVRRRGARDTISPRGACDARYAGDGGEGGGDRDERGGGDGAGTHGPAAPGLLGVGVAMPGPLDHASGIARRVTGFPHWDGFPLRDALADRLDLPVTLDKDTNAAALGLAARAGAGSGSFAYLHLGTGLGAGLVLNGALYRGARTGAGEFGHQVVQLGGPPCHCGYRGCLEAICLAAVERGDLATAAGVLGEGAANLVALLDIDHVVLGGRTVAAHRERFLAGVSRVLGERPAGRGPGAVPVTAAGDGTNPVAVGAAHLVLAPVFGLRMG
ncbi:ROK family transcriptional regulator [Streptomyces fuscigenes]|uniref:ROK family transcriptional regulator n=1 Tax=Streptomyces fuscigenes TaxID=1528880 RepID=UPI003556A09A